MGDVRELARVATDSQDSLTTVMALLFHHVEAGSLLVDGLQQRKQVDVHIADDHWVAI